MFKNKVLQTALLLFFLMNDLLTQHSTNKIPVGYPEISNITENKSNGKYFCRNLEIESAKITEDYLIGPEIPVTGATGFYDYQSNGECRRYINRFSGNILMTIYLTALDSNNISDSRRTIYSGSTNDGDNWNFISQIPPNIRSGFPSLTTTVNGSAIIYNNNIFNNSLAKELTPLSGVFSYYNAPLTLLQSLCSRLSNGKIIVSGLAVLDSVAAVIFDPNSNTFQFTNIFSAGQNIRVTHSAGPDGRALMLFISPMQEKIYISYTTNSGELWSLPQVVFEAGLINGEYVSPFFGIDAIYDRAGNYYIAFNSTDSVGYFSSAKLWVSKNGGTPVLVAQHSGLNGIPEAANTVLHADAGLCTIDHPSLSVSSDDSILYISYGVLFQNDTLNGFNKSHIYISTSRTDDLQFSAPIKVTNSGPLSFDERYSSLNQTTPYLDPVNKRTVYLVYQKDPQPGSCAFNDNAPVSRSSLIFRKITDLTYPVIGVTNNNTGNPKDYILFQNYPNPFNPETSIDFQIPVDSRIKITLYNSIGQLLYTIIDKNYKKGSHNVIFNSSEFSSGVYFYKLEANKFSISKKLVILK